MVFSFILNLQFQKMKRNLFIAVCVAVSGFMLLIWFVVVLMPEHLNYNYYIDLNKASQIGAFVGGFIGALFTIAGFILLYETFRLQRRESKATRKFLKLQQFENNFFQLFKRHNDIVSSMNIGKEKRDSEGGLETRTIFYSGRECFDHLSAELCLKLKKYHSDKNLAKKEYNSFFRKLDLDLNHYYAQIKLLLKYLEFSVPDKNRIYVDIFKANLSGKELVLMFYYISFSEDEEFSVLINKYEILKNFDETQLANASHFELLKKQNATSGDE